MKTSMKRIWTGRNCVVFLVTALMAVGILAAGQVKAEENDGLVVGTYDPRQVFQQSAGQQELMKAYQGAQKPMQKAQEQQDQEKMQKIQADLQKKQMEIIEKFQGDLQKVLPEVAEKTGVQVIAQGVEYVAGDIEKKDVTGDVIKALGGDPKAGKKNMMRQLQKKK